MPSRSWETIEPIWETESEADDFMEIIGRGRPRKAGMNQVKVNKNELQDAVSDNMAIHRAVYQEAMKGYKQAAVAWLEQRLDDLRDGRPVRLYFPEPVPEDHSDDYKRTLKMIEWSVDDEIQLSAEEFAQFVMDDWGWKKQWSATTSSYLST